MTVKGRTLRAALAIPVAAAALALAVASPATTTRSYPAPYPSPTPKSYPGSARVPWVPVTINLEKYPAATQRARNK